ncbi:MAG: salicylate hydroxylase [Parvibaculaceae bacterium]|jgi:salicylate hydroxylase
MDVLIAGAGMGGLTAALAVHKQGMTPHVFEQSADIKEVGAGLQIGPNGSHVLRALDVLDSIAARAFRPQAAEMRFGPTGQQIFCFPLGAEIEARHGAPYLHIHRADLHQELAATLERRVPGALHLGASVAGFEQERTGARLILKDGTTVAGDVLIGADGIHSKVREGLFGPAKPRFTGNTAWRATVPAARVRENLIPPNATVWAGPHGHVVTYYLRGGELINIVGVREAREWQDESWTTPGNKQDLLDDFAPWCAEIQELLRAVNADTCFKWALHDREPMENWSSGRVSLLGDACHPTLPFLAQGAAMAIEDAYVLARSLAQCVEAPEQGLQAYQAARMERTAKVQLGSRANSRFFHKSSVLSQGLTYGPVWLAGKFAPGFIASQLDWLYGEDVTRKA